MKIVLAATIMQNESSKIFLNNIEHIRKMGFNLVSIANTINNINVDIKIHKIGDMKTSRHSILDEAYKINADLYFILDSDIDLTTLTKKDIINVKNIKYDFISFYYKMDPPIPAYYTLASSLTDFYNGKLKLFGKSRQFFDDSNFDDQTYNFPNSVESKKKIEAVLFGKSYARDIWEFTDKVNEHDFTTGGATVYKNKEALSEKYRWKKKNGKSLTWYDSYRTFRMSKKYKFAKIPIFVNHIRHNTSIQLSWGAVARYIEGYNYYQIKVNPSYEQQKLILHSVELYYYILGMIKKIKAIRLNRNETETINKISCFLDIDINKFVKGIKLWK